MRVEVRSKAIPASFLKIEKMETFVGAKDRRERERRLVELKGDQSPGPEAPARSKTARIRREQRR